MISSDHDDNVLTCQLTLFHNKVYQLVDNEGGDAPGRKTGVEMHDCRVAANRFTGF